MRLLGCFRSSIASPQMNSPVTPSPQCQLKAGLRNMYQRVLGVLCDKITSRPALAHATARVRECKSIG
eukprot:6184409-Pleurochrysis_carterae.AAC.3